MAKQTQPYIVRGCITNLQSQPIPGLTIRVFCQNPKTTDNSLGMATTDAQGFYTISITETDFKTGGYEGGGPNVFIMAFAGDQLLGKSDVVRITKKKIVIDLQVDYGKDDPNEPWRRVFGVVRNEFGETLQGMTVLAFDRDIRSEELLGSDLTQEGKYDIRYKKAQFRKAEKRTADVVVKLSDASGMELHKSPVFYNAPEELEVNINLKGAEYKGPSEWEVLSESLRPLLENLSPLELREDEQFQDVSFLSGETGHSQLVIGTWIVSHHLADKTYREQTPLEPAVFFGFMRQGQPGLLYDSLLQDIHHTERVELLKDKILRDLSNISPELQRQLLEKALTDNLIPARIRTDLDKILETLYAIKLRYAAASSFGPGKGTIGELLQLTPEAGREQAKFMAAFSAHTGPIAEFWKKLGAEEVFPPEVIRDLKLNFELGALTRNHIPLVAALNQKFKQQQVTAKRDLAKFDRAAWIEVFKSEGPDGTQIGVPANIDGETEEEKFKQYAVILEGRFERAYPTTSFMAKLEKNNQSAVAVKSDVTRFLNSNPDFHLDRYRIDHYLSENGDALRNVEDKVATVQQLKIIQRVFKLNPTNQAVEALLSRKIESAQQIYFMGKEQFVTALKDSGINKIESKRLYQKAENTYALALSYFGTYNLNVNGLTPFAIPDVPKIIATEVMGDNLEGVVRLEAAAQTVSLPNLQTLFGSLDFCECTHCRSVYSPAAHFVDMLRFLGERNTNGTTINLNKKVKQVLLERRPDLGEMELSCENTNTPLPYIDLVNEILEDVVAPPVPVVLNNAIEPDLTSGKIKTNVRTELAAKGLPVEADAEVYAQDSRNQWAVRDKQHAYKLFKSGGNLQILPTRQTHLAAAELRANPEYTHKAAYDKLALEAYPFHLPFNLWYIQSRIYLTHLGVPQPRLFELFQQKLVDGVTLVPGNLQIDCAWLGINETERKIVTGTLAGKQPWDFWGLAETGNNLPHPDTPTDPATNATGTWIAVLSQVSIILHRTGLTYKELLQVLDIPFVNPAGTVFINDNADSNAANCDVTKFQVIGLTANVLDRMHRFIRLWRRMGIAMWELDMLLPDTNPDPNIIDKRITDAVLQDISRMNRIREKFGWDWRMTRALYNNIDHSIYFDRSLSDAPSIQTLYQRLFRNKLVDATAVFPESPDVITGPIEGDDAALPPIPDKVPGILAAFRIKEEDLDLILTELSLTPASTLNWTVLSRIYRCPLLAKALGLNIDQFIRLKRLSAIDPFASASDTLTFIELAEKTAASMLTIQELDYLLTHRYRSNTGVALEDRTIAANLRAIREGLQQVVDDVTRNTEANKEAFLKQKIGEQFQLDAPSADLLLSQLQIPGSADSLLKHLNNANLLQKLPNGTYQFEINESNFPNSYKTMRLLHKNALVNGKLKWKAVDLTWWLTGTHSVDMNWPHPKDFPIDTSTSVPFIKWIQLADFFAWKKSLPVSELTAFEFMDGVLEGGVATAANIAALSELTATEETDLIDLITAFRWVVKQEFKKPESLVRLRECSRALRRLGVNAARAIVWAKAEPTFEDAESMKQTVKAKYDLAQWQQVIQPLQDVFREQKRNALVSWLVSQSSPNRMDANALYSYFLIDVEMNACMLTSRLKQAAASVQLFVQRCLMNLEMDISVRAEKTDPSDTGADSKWKQWKWMKYYRVWEANRKVFLYPENWIEPELRDEKSPFFKELENELMQNDINRETAGQAYLNYLEKMDKVANLEIRTIYNEVISTDESVLHVFGRTRTSVAPEFYYRKRINRGRWTAWEKVELEIACNHLVAGIHNRRLYLLWPQFLEKADEPKIFSIPTQGTTFTAQPPSRYWEIRMFWSEWKKGKWTPKTLSDSYSVVYQLNTDGNKPENLSLRTRTKPFIEVRIFASDKPANDAPYSITGFRKLGKQVSAEDIPTLMPFDHIISAPSSKFHNGLLKHIASSYYFYFSIAEDPKNQMLPSLFPANYNAPSIQVLRNIAPNESYSVLDAQAQAFTPAGSFFFWDANRTYFVDYQWQTVFEYVSQTLRSRVVSAFRFFTHYHPFVELFIKELNIWGLKGLLNRRIQMNPQSIPGSPPIFNFADYGPTSNVVKNYVLPDKSLSYPVEDVDFSYLGAYSLYNWELFFHVPFHIANKLAGNQRFEEALEWYHYIFNPTNTDNAVLDPDTPQQKYWITKHFYETTKADYYKQKIENLLLAIAKGDMEGLAQVKEWRDNPFNPHLIARMRTVAYQKTVLIKYIQTIIAWGDQLFRRNTMETINEATQLYILADSVLGPRPKSIPKKVANPVKTFYQLEKEGIDVFGNVLVEVENLLPSLISGSKLGEENPELPRLDVLYFCIPNNEKLLTMWDTVADRLYKIRHCMNIEGVVQQLPLFDPPIDPAALIRAVAGGLDFGSALTELNIPMPFYRFSFMVQRALELCDDVKSLGDAMLSALEKKDAEAFTVLSAGHELKMLDALREVKRKQIEEAERNWEEKVEGKNILLETKNYYEKLLHDGWDAGEITAFGLSVGVTTIKTATAVGYSLAGGLKLIPNFVIGAAGFGGTPEAAAETGGDSAGDAAENAVKTMEAIADALEKGAELATIVSEYERRSEEWDYQKRLAEKSLPQLDKQIAASVVLKQIAEIELANHDREKENKEKEREYMTTKFTNGELYDWMVNQISLVYFQSYQLAYDIAKRAERCFRYELGLSDSAYIRFGYWDSLKKGLLSGEKLRYDLKRMEAAYYEQNRREYELAKQISLAQLDPVGLLQLQQNGECIVDVPEVVFDMDYPGHYFRRIKSVSLTITCEAGPNVAIACTLTLASNKLRKDATLLAGKYERDLLADDPRFRDEIAPIQSIATSTAQDDSGLFELDFSDDRYLPFEGAGAISTWQIRLNMDFPQFDFATISDVVIRLNYSAREGGGALKAEAVKEFNKKMNAVALSENKKGLFRVYDLRQEFPAEWQTFLTPASPADDQALVLINLQNRLPYFTRNFNQKKVSKMEVVALAKDSAKIYKVMVSPLGSAPADLLTMSVDTVYQGLHHAVKDLLGSEVDLNTWTIKIRENAAADFKSLPADAIEKLFLIINYTIT